MSYRLIATVVIFVVAVNTCRETEGTLTKTPQNVVVLRGQDAVLNCSTDATSAQGQNPTIWQYDQDMISYAPCTSMVPGFVASPPDSATDCNVRALASRKWGISGAYKCTDYTEQAVAMVIVVDPACEVVQSVVEGGITATLMCRMTYEWQARARQFNAIPGVEVSLSWTGVPGTTVRTTADRFAFSGTVETEAVIEDITSDTIPSYSCKIEFNFSPGHSPYYQYAVNPVTSTCVTPPTTAERSRK